MQNKETVLTMVVEGDVGDTKVQTFLGHHVRSVQTEVRDAPIPWRMGFMEGRGDRTWRYIEAQLPDGRWQTIGMIRYYGDARIDVYATLNPPSGDPLFWLGREVIDSQNLAEKIWERWKQLYAS